MPPAIFENGFGPPLEDDNCTWIKRMATHEPLYRSAHIMTDIWQPAIIALGLLGNILIFLVMMQRSYRRNSCANYIAALAVSDSVALFRKSLDLFQIASGTTYSRASCCGWVYVALAACQFSTFLVVCMTIDRLISVRFPKKSVTFCRPKRARIIMAVCLCVVLAFNVPHILLTEPVAQNRYCASFRSKKWESLALPYGILQGLVNFVIPFIALLIMTSFIIATLRRNRKRHLKLNEKEIELRSSLSNNVITNIFTDGLFHYVISYAAKTLFEKKRKEKKWRKISSVFGRKQKNNEEDGNDDIGQSSSKQAEGSENEGFTPESNLEEKKEGDIQAGIISEDEMNSPDQEELGIETYRNNSDNSGLGEEADTHRQDTVEKKSSDQSNACFVNEVFTAGKTEEDLENKPQNEICDTSYAVPETAGDLGSPEYCDDTPQRRKANPKLNQSYSRQESSVRRKNDAQLSFLLLLVVFFFIVLTSLQFIRYLIYTTKLLDDCKNKFSYSQYFIIYHVSNKLYFTNCAINFYIYILGSSMFRANISDLFVSAFAKCRKLCGRPKPQSSFPSETWEKKNAATQTETSSNCGLQTVCSQTMPVQVITLSQTYEDLGSF